MDSHSGVYVVIIGNGAAGNSASSVIRQIDKNTNITVISEEIFPQYSACLLPNYLSGEIQRQRVFLKSLDDYSKEAVNTIFGQRVVGIDIKDKRVILDKQSRSYDRLVIATGSKPVVPPIEGINQKGVFTFKSLEDTDKISEGFTEKVVVIGSGPIGIEASVALKKRGCEVFLVELLDQILPTLFDEKPSLFLKKIMQRHGVKVFTEEKAIRISGNGEVEGVITENQKMECDAVILTVGMRPNVELARQAGLKIGKLGGIKVNEQMMTCIEDIYACGDCIETKDAVTGEPTLSLLWHSARQQGDVAAYNCAGIKQKYPGSQNIVGIDIFGDYAISIGGPTNRFNHKNLEIIEKGDSRSYYRIILANGVPVGIQSINKTEDVGVVLGAIRRRDNINRLKQIVNYEKLLSMNPWSYRIAQYIK